MKHSFFSKSSPLLAFHTYFSKTPLNPLNIIMSFTMSNFHLEMNFQFRNNESCIEQGLENIEVTSFTVVDQ